MQKDKMSDLKEKQTPASMLNKIIQYRCFLIKKQLESLGQLTQQQMKRYRDVLMMLVNFLKNNRVEPSSQRLTGKLQFEDHVKFKEHWKEQMQKVSYEPKVVKNNFDKATLEEYNDHKELEDHISNILLKDQGLNREDPKEVEKIIKQIFQYCLERLRHRFLNKNNQNIFLKNDYIDFSQAILVKKCESFEFQSDIISQTEPILSQMIKKIEIYNKYNIDLATQFNSDGYKDHLALRKECQERKNNRCFLLLSLSQRTKFSNLLFISVNYQENIENQCDYIISAFLIFRIIFNNRRLKLFEITGVKVTQFQIFAKFLRVSKSEIYQFSEDQNVLRKRIIQNKFVLQSKYKDECKWIKQFDKRQIQIKIGFQFIIDPLNIDEKSDIFRFFHQSFKDLQQFTQMFSKNYRIKLIFFDELLHHSEQIFTLYENMIQILQYFQQAQVVIQKKSTQNFNYSSSDKIIQILIERLTQSIGKIKNTSLNQISFKNFRIRKYAGDANLLYQVRKAIFTLLSKLKPQSIVMHKTSFINLLLTDRINADKLNSQIKYIEISLAKINQGLNYEYLFHFLQQFQKLKLINFEQFYSCPPNKDRKRTQVILYISSDFRIKTNQAVFGKFDKLIINFINDYEYFCQIQKFMTLASLNKVKLTNVHMDEGNVIQLLLDQDHPSIIQLHLHNLKKFDINLLKLFDEIFDYNQEIKLISFKQCECQPVNDRFSQTYANPLTCEIRRSK